jgi:hypothetical protein
MNETKNCVIHVSEEKPSSRINNEWKNTYENYTTGSSLLGQKIPKCRIYLYEHLPGENETIEKEEKIDTI